MDEKVECSNCGWSGLESELEMDDYEMLEVMPIANLCPKCKSDMD